MKNTILEVCCGSVDFAAAAAAAGADRIELCDNLVEGGTTPSVGAVQLAAARLMVPVMAMVRPRGGDFLYSPLEFEVMLRDVDALANAGASGLVFGVLDADGRIVIADVGHYESEWQTTDLILKRLNEKFPNFALHLAKANPNPIHYR